MPGGGEAVGERVEAGGAEGRVRLAGGAEVGVDAEVQLDRRRRGARGRRARRGGGLADLGHAEDLGEEAAAGGLGAGGMASCTWSRARRAGPLIRAGRSMAPKMAVAGGVADLDAEGDAAASSQR